LNGKTINDAWVNPSGELTWLHPVTGAMEVIPDTARVHVDHVLPKNYILNKIPEFKTLPAAMQKHLLDSADNLQPMLVSANCSKGCKVQWINGGWQTWNGQPINPDYKKYLENAQVEFREKIIDAIAARRAGG